MSRGYRFSEAGGVTPSSEYYLYKAGDQKVAFANGQYSMLSSYTLVGGAIFSTNYFSITTPNNGDRCNNTIITSNTVDMSNYTMLKVQTDLWGTVALDITSINSGYVYVVAYRSVGANYSFYIGASSQQANFESSPLVHYISSNYNQIITLQIYNIWLE